VSTTFDVLIIGAGLSGLFAACLAARRGKKTLLLARGIGGTHIGTGTIDVSANPALIARTLPSDHPYSLVGKKVVQSALDELTIVCAESGYPMHGRFGKNFSLPTAAGGVRQACLVPETMLAGSLARKEPLAIASLPGFRDFDAAFAAANLGASGLQPRPGCIALPLSRMPVHRDSYATDLARLFDRPDFRDETVAAWKPLLEAAPKRIGLPAVLGLDFTLQAKQHLESALGVELFEIPLLPPSVPGMRLFNLLRADFENHGGQLILGLACNGRVENGSLSVRAEGTGRDKEYQAETVILATGGFLNGGLVAEFEGAIRETVFNLPVLAPNRRSEWTSETFLGPHPFARFGVRVNKNMQPLDANGKPAAAHLRAIGGLLAGADRLSEGSREGIAIATAWKAIETLGAQASK
jgi:glycerol-3-phosphate dehydrogenase subunit B